MRVKLYLMEKLFDGKPTEKRESKWVTYVSGVKELTHGESQHVLKMAETVRKQ